MKESYAYVTRGDAGLVIIDVTSPSTPVEVGIFEEETVDVALAGQYAYAISDTGLRVIDVSVPSALVVIGTTWGFHHAEGVVVSGDLVFVACQHELQVFEVSDLFQPL